MGTVGHELDDAQKEFNKQCDECSVGPIAVDLFRFVDDRGILDQLFNLDLPNSFPFGVKRIYTTVSNKGIIRGMHGHQREWKAFYVANGMVKFVVYKMGEEPDLLGYETKTFVLSDAKPQLFILPPGYWHGYMSLTENARIIILSSASLEETKKDDHREDPEKFKWEFEVKGR